MILDADNVPIDLRGEDFNVIPRDMEIGIPEQVNKNDDGSYTVFLNTRYTHEKWIESMEHVFNHVRGNDWEKDCVQSIEVIRHREVI